MTTSSAHTIEPAAALLRPELSCRRSNAESAAQVTVAGELDIAMAPQLELVDQPPAQAGAPTQLTPQVPIFPQ